MSDQIVFRRIMNSAIEPMLADKTGMGGIPAAAHQFCESLRSASGFGWYGFPPLDIRLRWDGSDVFIETELGWEILHSKSDSDFANEWDKICPPELVGMKIPYISSLFVPGIVQIWTGLTVKSADEWSVLVRPIANITPSRQFSCYEGLIETDWFAPVPLFINIRLHAIDTIIDIPRLKPLFQIQPIHRNCYTSAMSNYKYYAQTDGEENSMTAEEWVGFVNTLRSISPNASHQIGRYGAEVRRRARN